VCEISAIAVDLALKCADIGRLAAPLTFRPPCLKEPAVALRPLFAPLRCTQFLT
jgi:hypothetical protein